MMVQFVDSKAGAPVYLNPDWVVSVRPDPVEPEHFSVIKVRDGESLRVNGDHRQVTEKLRRIAA